MYICTYIDLSLLKISVYTHIHSFMHLRRNIKFQKIMARNVLSPRSFMGLIVLKITGKLASMIRP